MGVNKNGCKKGNAEKVSSEKHVKRIGLGNFFHCGITYLDCLLAMAGSGTLEIRMKRCKVQEYQNFTGI